MKKNLFKIDLNNSSAMNESQPPQKACDPCAAECKRINKKINNRKSSEINNNDIDQVINVFDLKV